MTGALAEVHARGVVHKDVKPLNILSEGRVAPRVQDAEVQRAGGADETLTGFSAARGWGRCDAPSGYFLSSRQFPDSLKPHEIR